MVTLIDLEAGNLGSVSRALEHVGARVTVTSNPEDVARAQALILPGVGSFGDAMAVLRAKGLVEPIRQAVLSRGVALLGICVGMQVLATRGEEFGCHPGLGLIPGRVVRLPEFPGCRIPNMGWCPVRPMGAARGVLEGLKAEEAFYFAHSYHFVCDDPADMTANTPWGDGQVAAAVARGAVQGVQFHPEKSQDAGLAALHAFWTAVSSALKEKQCPPRA
jgi:glutamine amidotransferase